MEKSIHLRKYINSNSKYFYSYEKIFEFLAFSNSGNEARSTRRVVMIRCVGTSSYKRNLIKAKIFSVSASVSKRLIISQLKLRHIITANSSYGTVDCFWTIQIFPWLNLACARKALTPRRRRYEQVFLGLFRCSCAWSVFKTFILHPGRLCST